LFFTQVRGLKKAQGGTQRGLLLKLLRFPQKKKKNKRAARLAGNAREEERGERSRGKKKVRDRNQEGGKVPKKETSSQGKKSPPKKRKTAWPMAGRSPIALRAWDRGRELLTAQRKDNFLKPHIGLSVAAVEEGFSKQGGIKYAVATSKKKKKKKNPPRTSKKKKGSCANKKARKGGPDVVQIKSFQGGTSVIAAEST